MTWRGRAKGAVMDLESQPDFNIFFFSKQTWPALREEIHQSRRKKDDNRWQSGLSVRGRFRSAAAREKSGEGSSID